ncbi:MAG: ECF-type sigma factor [Planctomycetota bacterium]
MASTDDDPAALQRILESVRAREDGADDRLFDAIYARLLKMARARFREEAAGHTLQPTALVNEAWLRLSGTSPDFENEAHLFGAASRAMRRILVDHARQRNALKRGGNDKPITLSDVDGGEQELDVLEVEDALRLLEAEDARVAEMVRLRFFGGLSTDEIARIQQVSPRTVKREWAQAKAWLLERLGDEGETPE